MAITFLSVVIAGILAGEISPPPNLYLAALAAALIAGAANALNDFCDRDIDRVNKPHRPLPSGQVGTKSAIIGAMTLFVLGLAVSSFSGTVTLIIAVAAVVLLVLYDFRLKRRPVSGNLVVAGLGGVTFLYGGAAVGSPYGAIIPAVFAFLYHFGREITKDMEDEPADRTAGAATIPIRYGRRAASMIARSAFILLILLTPLPFILDLYGTWYLVCVVPTVDFLLAVVVVGIGPAAGDESIARLNRLNRLLKVGMVLGLVSLFLGRF
jgi:geranylgeranylglycerol-phosphate geranylgeranyltransferase